MSNEVNVDVTPDVDVNVTDVEVDTDVSDVDAEEAEYQAAMAAIKGESKEAVPKDSDDEEESEEESEDEESEEEVKEEKQPESKIWKLKVNGEEIDFDASNEARVKQEVQKGLGADAKFQEASQMRRQAESFMNALKNNPESVLTHPSLGINFRELAENFLYKQIQQEQMTPEERERATERSELERFRKEEAERKQQVEEQEKAQMRQRYQEEWTNKFQDALATGGVPKTDWTISRMAQYMKQAITKGHQHVQPQDVVEYVKQDWINAQREMFSSLEGDKLMEIVGKETADKIRKANLAQYQKTKQPSKPLTSKPKKAEDRQTFSSLEQMREAIRLGKV
jgi:hypothetical protein